MKKRLGMRILRLQDLDVWAGQETPHRDRYLANGLTNPPNDLKGQDQGSNDFGFLVSSDPFG